MARRNRSSGQSSIDFGILADPRARLPKLFAFGNIAVGFIAVGNVAVGVIAIGASLAIGPIAIGVNSVGWVLALGLNAAGTLCGALINGLGVFGGAGVNGIGTHFHSFVNLGQSIFIAALGLIVQAAIALKMSSQSRELPKEIENKEPRVRLLDLLRGGAEQGKVEASILFVGDTFIRIADKDNIEAELTLSGAQLPGLKAFQALSPRERRPMLFSVRASEEPIFSAPNTDYRAAPPTSRVLWADDVEFLPLPIPFWAKPGAMRSMTQWSL